MPEKTFYLTSSGSPSTGVRVGFVVTRTRLTRVAATLPTGMHLQSLTISSAGVEIGVEPALAAGEKITLQIGYEGELPAYVREAWRGLDGAWHSPATTDPGAQILATTPHFESALRAATASDHARLAETPDAASFASAIRFFAAYDLATNPERKDVVLPDDRLTSIKIVTRLLINRVNDRLARKQPRSESAAHVAALSSLQLQIYADHFGLDDGALDASAFGEAFLRFANGDLRDAQRSQFGQPNGPGAFLFAEFALLVRDLKLGDWARWQPLLPGLVRMLYVYVKVYRPTTVHWSWDDWSFLNYKGGLDENQLARVRADFTESDLEGQLFRLLKPSFKVIIADALR